MGKLLTFIACPLCGMSRKLERTGRYADEVGRTTKDIGRIRFAMDLEQAFIVDIRETPGGKVADTGAKGRGKAPATGFPRVDGKTLEDMAQDEEYADVVEAIRSGAQNILAILDTED